MDVSVQLPKPRKSITTLAGVGGGWHLSRRLILFKIADGIFVCTRQLDVTSRNHFAALLVARQLCDATGEPVTVVNLDGYKARRLLAELKFPEAKLHVVERWKSYPDYLRD